MVSLRGNTVPDTLAVMSFAFAYRFREDEPSSSLKELDRVILLVAAVSDDGDRIAAGAEGTILSVHGAGEGYVVEFAAPVGALATVLPDHIRRLESAGR